MEIQYADREAWLIEAANTLSAVLMVQRGISLSIEKTRLSCGFPPGRRGGSKHVVAGVCFPRSRSTDGVNEVFISPLIDDPAVILPTLLHELLHAVDDCQHGHGREFVGMCRVVGLNGPYTATVPNAQLTATLRDIADALGPYPHARITRENPNKQSTRLLKCWCGRCQAIWRMSARWVPTLRVCPCCLSSEVHTG